jgi:hypothetical protein
MRQLVALLSGCLLVLLGLFILIREIWIHRGISGSSLPWVFLFISILVLFRCAFLRTPESLPSGVFLFVFSCFMIFGPLLLPRLGSLSTLAPFLASAGLFFLFRYLIGKGGSYSLILGGILLFIGLEKILRHLRIIRIDIWAPFRRPVLSFFEGAYPLTRLVVAILFIAFGLFLFRILRTKPQ